MRPIEVSGQQISLSEGRRVWAARHDDSWYIRFTSAEGAVHLLRISFEAAEALVSLIGNPKEEVLMRYLFEKSDIGETSWKAVSDDGSGIDTTT